MIIFVKNCCCIQLVFSCIKLLITEVITINLTIYWLKIAIFVCNVIFVPSFAINNYSHNLVVKNFWLVYCPSPLRLSLLLSLLFWRSTSQSANLLLGFMQLSWSNFKILHFPSWIHVQVLQYILLYLVSCLHQSVCRQNLHYYSVYPV